MSNRGIANRDLLQEIEELRVQLAEAQETLDAIGSGEVDALVVYGQQQSDDRVYTLQGADHPYRVMVESMYEGAATLTPDGTILYCNRRIADMLRIHLESLLGSSFLRFLQPSDRDAYDALVSQSTEGTGRAEFWLVCDDGDQIPVLLSMSPVQVEGERSICLVATDLTEQKRNEEIVASERMARSILEQAAEAIVVCDESGIIIRASNAARQYLHHNPLFQPLEKLMTIEIEGGAEANQPFSIRAVLNGQSINGAPAWLKLPPENGTASPVQRNVLLSAAPLRNDHGSILGCTVALTDITERRQAEAMLRDAELHRRLMEQTEQERLRIARNLHDGPLQDLISLSFTLQLMLPLDQTDPSIELVVIRHDVLKLIQDLRMVCNELRPSKLVRFGLAKAIRNATEDFSSRFPGLKVHLDLNDDEQLLSNELRMAFLRIYQESLNNIARHANASEAWVSLRLKESGTVSLKVEDNGSGFILPQEWVEFARLGHLGLVGMRERIEAVGGSLQVVTSPGNGTIILVTALV